MERVEVTPEIMDKILTERIRTNVAVQDFLKYPKAQQPDGLNIDKINYLFRDSCRRFRKDYLDFILSSYAALPDAPVAESRVYGRLRNGNVEISNAVRSELQNLHKSTGISPAKLLIGALDRPKTLSSTIVRTWLSGDAKTANKDDLVYVLELWRSHAVAKTGRVTITPEIRAELKRYQHETGIGAMALLNRHKNRPKDINSGTISGWMRGNIKKAQQAHLDFVLEAWRNVDPVLPFTQEMIDVYNAEIERSGVQGTTLCRMLEAVDVHLKPNMLSRRLCGRKKTISKAEHSATLKLLKSLPNK